MILQRTEVHPEECPLKTPTAGPKGPAAALNNPSPYLHGPHASHRLLLPVTEYAGNTKADGFLGYKGNLCQPTLVQELPGSLAEPSTDCTAI